MTIGRNKYREINLKIKRAATLNPADSDIKSDETLGLSGLYTPESVEMSKPEIDGP